MNQLMLFLPQFGADKDVFALRFARNSHITFHHLYKCGEEEKSKVTCERNFPFPVGC